MQGETRKTMIFGDFSRCRCRKLCTAATRAALTMYHSNGTRRATHAGGTAPVHPAMLDFQCFGRGGFAFPPGGFSARLLQYPAR